MNISVTASTKTTEELHCAEYLHPVLRPVFFQPTKRIWGSVEQFCGGNEAATWLLLRCG